MTAARESSHDCPVERTSRGSGVMLFLALAALGAAAIGWTSADRGDRDRLEQRLNGVPVFEYFVPDPGPTIAPLAPGSGDDSGIRYPVK